jgi:hypothetical protein
MDLYVLNGTTTGQKYRDNIIRNIVVPHFDNHRLATRPLFMDDNTRQHIARIVSDYLRQESIDSIPWPAMSPDMNPFEHLSDDIYFNTSVVSNACNLHASGKVCQHVVSCFEQGGVKFSRVCFAIPGPKHHAILVNTDMLESDH